LKNTRESSYQREIAQLSGTVGKLNENRDAINSAVEKINAIGYVIVDYYFVLTSFNI
jgi:hypothetical protein